MDEDHDIEMDQEEQAFDSKEVVLKWKEKFGNNQLSMFDLESHWNHWVPKLFSPPAEQSCLNTTYNEQLVQKALFDTLEEFICDGNPATVLPQLEHMDRPAVVCGRVFKMGEPTYSCRECGMDSTCVLCVDCFKQSEHRHHKYRMGTSGGGGCCDCGDVEAWKKAPFCNIHIAGTMDDDGARSVPQDLLDRTRIVFSSVLWYAYNKLNTEECYPRGFEEDFDDMFDHFCTILYNDEVHTFEQVITTLRKILNCNQRSAIEYVTNVDREGRAVVKCSSFKACNDLREEIKKYTSRHGSNALKVVVTHASVIAHQIYSMRLLTWLQNFLTHGVAFRSVFAEVALEPTGKEPCIIKYILLQDSTLWKNARTLWHRLLISGMLLEYDNKKELGKMFTKFYGQVMKDFIKDDHDHSYSVSSLSVQLFTVPTLAHYLIANEDILYILLNAFISECLPKCNKAGKLEFERQSSSPIFKRAQYMLFDLRYLLNSVPEVWTDDLRRSFLHGMSVLLNILTMMQGMDAVTRQVGQHLEYEPEWESAFNLHIKLAYCISLAVKWCGTDKVVLVKMYRATLKKLEENPCYDPNEAGEVRELADHSTACLYYDVSSKPVSIHLPLSRFLAGLHLHLEKFGLHFDGAEFQVAKPTPVQIIEPVLRSQVMIAQVNSGMWRRNGYALLNQLYFYHNVKCRSEMLDRDVTLLQIGASLIESNEFLIHLLNKFGLINWATPDFEITSLRSSEEETKNSQSQDSMRQTISLVEEFLQLLIVIIGERYMPGVSDVSTRDRIKKEIIQHLCVKPLPHSELGKTIPDDLSHDTALDEVIEELADFIKPTQSSGKGVYKLKSPYYDDYNVFFYHYTKEDLSKSEEEQRKRHKESGELECCPPPKLLKLSESFSLVVNVLHCDVMLHIIQTVLTRCLNLRARSFSETQLHKILHLIGYALQEEESGNYPFFKFVENSAKFNLLPLMEELIFCGRVDAHKDLLKWTLQKFRQLSNRKEKGTLIDKCKEEFNDMMSADPNTAAASTSPSPSTSNTDPSAAETQDTDKARRARLAAERRAKIMAQMAAQQRSFMKENAKLFEDNLPERRDSQGDAMGAACADFESQTVALGKGQTSRCETDRTYTCILCQEEGKVSIDGPTLVFAAFVQQATVLCHYRNNDSLMEVSSHDPLYLHANLGPAPHTSTCGHVMHGDCWRKYFDNVLLKEHRRPFRPRHLASFDVDKQEFLCPLCECLSNTILPLVPSLATVQPTGEIAGISFEEWLTSVSAVVQNKIKMCHGIIFKCNEGCQNHHCQSCISALNIDPLETSIDCEANCALQPHQVFLACPDGSVPKIQDVNVTEPFKQLFSQLLTRGTPKLSPSLHEMIQLFSQVTYTKGLNVSPHPSDKRIAPLLWKSLSYTIHAVEVLLRDADKPLLGHLSSRQRDCIESLVRVAGIFGSTATKSVVLNSHCLNLLSMLLENFDDAPSILHWDSLGLLVPLTFCLPSLADKDQPTPVPTGGELECHTLRLVFVCHIVKLLLMMNVDEVNVKLDNSMETDTNIEGGEELLFVLKQMNKSDRVNLNLVWNHVQTASMPFLRCCTLFYHYLTDVPAPSNLVEPGGDTFNNICTYLGLPVTPKELFASQPIQDLIVKWCRHTEILLYINGTSLPVVPEPLPINQLIDLPTDYSELINTVSRFVCPNSDHEDSRNPTMCLVCGEMLCSQSYCCQIELNKTSMGACNYHAHHCGAGVGIFLRVRECEILLLASPHRGCYISPPYLDDYGETDQGLRRGNPLRLSKEKYKQLHTLWLSHGIHESIARHFESGIHSVVATQWHHF